MKKEKVAVFVATLYCSKLIPPALVKSMAGTYGSLVALPLCYYAIKAGQYSTWLYILILLAVFLIGKWCVPLAEVELGPMIDWGGKIMSSDQDQIVIDEVLGMLVTCMPLIWLPAPSMFDFILRLLIAFILFRLFDAIKLSPASLFDEWHCSSGVMLDDAMAGLYAGVVLTLLTQVFKLI